MSALTEQQTRELAAELHRAEQEREQVRHFSSRFPSMTIDDGYAISHAWVDLKVAAGEKIIGHKIGLTSRAMQVSSQIDEPDFGTLLDGMLHETGDEIAASRFIKPRVEVELAFILRSDLGGPSVSVWDVMRATERVVPALEIIDARIEQFDRESGAPRRVQDTISDNAANAGIVVGANAVRPDDVDLGRIGALLYVDGVIEESGLAAAVLGHPARGIAWLAQRLHAHGQKLTAGQIVLAGSFTRPVPLQQGSVVHADYGPLGAVTFRLA